MAQHDERVAIRAQPTANGQAPAAVDLVRLFGELRDELVSTLLYVLGNQEDAKDAAQDCFVKCWNARGELAGIVNVRAWVFRVAFNTAKDMRRSAWRRRVRPLRAEEHTLTAKEAEPMQSMGEKETVESLRRAVLELREEERDVFLLRQNGDFTYEQIAEMHGCPVGTIKTRMRTALVKLRKVLCEA